MKSAALELGLAVKMVEGPSQIIGKVRSFGLSTCHIGVRDPAYYNEETRRVIMQQLEQHEVRATGLWAGWPGRVSWDLLDGPATVGLVPYETRAERTAVIKQGADWAAQLGIDLIITHLGFVPEDGNDPQYTSLVPVLQDIARHLEANGQVFVWETGQETPTTLQRTIEDVGMSNVGVNLDPANLVLYGKGNPVDAARILGPHIRAVHVKDGTYPTNTRGLGEEKVVGEGQIDFPRMLEQLAEAGYDGTLCIECEFTGEPQAEAIRTAIERLQNWLAVPISSAST